MGGHGALTIALKNPGGETAPLSLPAAVCSDHTPPYRSDCVVPLCVACACDFGTHATGLIQTDWTCERER